VFLEVNVLECLTVCDREALRRRPAVAHEPVAVSGFTKLNVSSSGSAFAIELDESVEKAEAVYE